MKCCKGVWAKGEGGSDGGSVRRGKGLKLVRRRKGTGGGGGSGGGGESGGWERVHHLRHVNMLAASLYISLI